MHVFESEYNNFLYQIFKRKRRIKAHYGVQRHVNKLNREADASLFARVNT